MNNAVSHSWISPFSLFQMTLFQMNLSAEFVNCPARLLLDRSLFSVPLVQVFGKTMENVRKRVVFGCSDLRRRNESLGELHGPLLSDKRSSMSTWLPFKIGRSECY